MSQMVTRKGPLGDDKEKGHTDTPVKEMKKKMAANAEKEKNAAEKSFEKDKAKDKGQDKQPEKAEKPGDKKEKGEKGNDKKDKNVEKEKNLEKEKNVEKEKDKPAEKKTEAPAEKPKEDKNAKPEKQEDKEKDKKQASKTPPATDTPKAKQNGARGPANGLPSAAATNGAHSDATVSSDEEMVIDHERDDMFPELAYEDSDGEFEPPTPEGLPSRSYTRRDQAKATRTPETPRPASERRADVADDPKESKILKLKEDTPSTDRKLRSSDSPKPESKKAEKAPEKKAEKEKEVAKEAEQTKTDNAQKKKDLEVPEAKDAQSAADKSTVEVVVHVDGDEEGKGQERSKADTNYSRSRVKVSPYRRAKIADQTASSVVANYTGNNTTMEMDITETSSLLADEPSPESPYLSALRGIRGRRSYKPLREVSLRSVGANRSVRSTASLTVSEQPSRPTAPVVGRKRRPEGDDGMELGADAHELEVRGKRARLLDKLARPFRAMASTPLPARRNAEIVGINTDLPLTAPVASPDTFDPETLKATSVPLAPPLPAAAQPDQERDGKRCVVM